MFQLLVSGITACLLGLALTCVVRKVAPQFGLVDQPDGHRKLHRSATSLGGGIAVFLAALIVTVVSMAWYGGWLELSWERQRMLVGLAIAGLAIVVVGALDDRFGIRGRQKLFAQIVIALILVGFGVNIQNVQVFSWRLELGSAGILFTVFWLLGAMNAINLLDGIDGLATTVGLILTAAIAAMAITIGRMEIALVATVFACSLVGFLCFNFPPASIFLGDAGSMLIGLVVGALAIESSLKGPGTVLLAAPLAIWTIPILDSLAAILRRKLTGRSIYTTDRAHFHHRLMDRWKCNRKSLAFAALCCATTSLAGLGSIILNNDLIALMTCVALLALLISFRIFGHAEFRLAANRFSSMGNSLLTPFWNKQGSTHHSSVRLQGSRKWEILWESLVEWAEKMKLCELRLDLNLPLVQEGYYASWKQSGRSEADREWRFTLPLVVSGNRIGTLFVVAERSQDTAAQDLETLLCLLEPFEVNLNKIAEEISASPASMTAADPKSISPVLPSFSLAEKTG